MKMVRIQRRDAAEAPIIEALRKAGASVAKLTDKNVPDLLVGYLNKTYLMEVKNPKGPKGGTAADGQKLAPGQVAFHASWRGEPVVVVRSPADALKAIGCGAVANGNGTVCPEQENAK